MMPALQRLTARINDLAAAVEREHPPPEFDPSIGHLIGNWVSREEPASLLATPMAEAHIHGYLEEAFRIGTKHGFVLCTVLWWPLTTLVLLAALVLLRA
jgi:hypothetical protein